MQNIIDISHYQTVTDWRKVKASVDAIILKATQGHGLTTSSYLFTDSKFHEYAKACIKYQIPFGAYHFFTGSTVADAVREADYFAEVLAPYRSKIIYAVCDAENYNNKWLLGLSRSQLSANINAFCRRMEEHGYVAAHYTNTDHIRSYIYLNSIPYPVWQANYGNTRPTDARGNLIAWQFTSNGTVNGIKEKVDKNHGYIPDAEFAIIRLAALDVINTPSYWHTHYKDKPYIDTLLIRCADVIKKSGKPCATLDEALAKLVKRGIVNTPEYWQKNADEPQYLPDLIKKLGGAL